MSDPRLSKRDRELGQVRAFLTGAAIPFLDVECGSDPPDVIVRRRDEPPIAIEVTEYHPEEERVGLEARWRRFRTTIDDRVQERPALKGVSIDTKFCDPRIPGVRDQERIADELVRCAEWARQAGHVGSEHLKLSFDDDVRPGTMDQIDHHWFTLPGSEWPVLTKYLDVLYLTHISWDGYFLTHNLEANTAWSSPYAEALKKPLDKKEADMLGAIRDGRFAKGEEPLWLLIVSNTVRDLTSWIYRDHALKEVLEETGFDFEGSVFDRVWLLNDSNGLSQSLYPWVDPI